MVESGNVSVLQKFMVGWGARHAHHANCETKVFRRFQYLWKNFFFQGSVEKFHKIWFFSLHYNFIVNISISRTKFQTNSSMSRWSWKHAKGCASSIWGWWTKMAAELWCKSQIDYLVSVQSIFFSSNTILPRIGERSTSASPHELKYNVLEL